MKKTIFLILLLLICFIQNTAGLTLEEAKKIALENNPELLAKEEAKKSANWSVKGAMMSFLPSAQLTGNYTKYDPSIPSMSPNTTQEDSKSYGVSITQPIFNGGKIWYNAKMQKDKEKIANYNLNNQFLQTITNVESKYFSVLEQKELLDNT